MVKDETFIVLTIVICITVLGVAAISRGMDSGLLLSVFTTLGGALGYFVRSRIEKKKK